MGAPWPIQWFAWKKGHLACKNLPASEQAKETEAWQNAIRNCALHWACQNLLEACRSLLGPLGGSVRMVWHLKSTVSFPASMDRICNLWFALLSLPIVCDSLWFQVANKYGWWMMLTSRPRSGLFLYKGPLPLSKAHIKAVEAIRRSEISTPEKPHAAVSGPKRYQCKGAVISVRLPGRRNKALNWPHIWTSLI